MDGCMDCKFYKYTKSTTTYTITKVKIDGRINEWMQAAAGWMDGTGTVLIKRNLINLSNV